MDSTGRFLLGGALGAALGYLLSQKNLEKVQQTDEVPVPVSAPPTPLSSVGSIVAPESIPAVSDVAPSAPSLWAPEQRTAPVSAPEESVSEWKIPETPNVPISLVTPPATPAYLGEAPAAVESVAVEPAESEVLLTREFLEEPLPGSGWHSSAPPLLEDDTFETAVHDIPVVELAGFGQELAPPPAIAESDPTLELPLEQVFEDDATELPVLEDVVELPVVEKFVELPVVQETLSEVMGPGTAGNEALAQAADVMGRLPVVESPVVDDMSRVDDLKSRIEETRRRIRHELEQPFDISAPARPLERDWTMVPAVTAVERPIVAEPPVTIEPAIVEPVAFESVALESTVEEPLVMEPLEMESVVVEALPMESEVMQPLSAEPVAVEQVAAEPVAVEQVAAEPVVIEAVTEESFVMEPAVMEPAVMEPPMVEPLAIVPLPTEAIAQEPVIAEGLELASAPEQPIYPAAAEVPVVELEAESSGGALAVELDTEEPELDTEEPVDYDSMKNRIESTRSRLKAKAFDAMMTGESALLGRDAEGASLTPGKVTGVDSEVDETIETSLREEEE